MRNDPVTSSIVRQMRTLMYQKVEGTGSVYNTLSSIGIKTRDYKEFGKLILTRTGKGKPSITTWRVL